MSVSCAGVDWGVEGWFRSHALSMHDMLVRAERRRLAVFDGAAASHKLSMRSSRVLMRNLFSVCDVFRLDLVGLRLRLGSELGLLLWLLLPLLLGSSMSPAILANASFTRRGCESLGSCMQSFRTHVRASRTRVIHCVIALVSSARVCAPYVAHCRRRRRDELNSTRCIGFVWLACVACEREMHSTLR